MTRGATAAADAGLRQRTRASRSISRRPRRPLFALVLALAGAQVCAVWAARPAFAYLRYRSDSGCPYAWHTRSVSITGFPQGLAGMTVDEITRAATGAVSVWTKRDPALAACTDLDLKVTMQPVTTTPPAAKFDRRNNLMFRSDTWCVTGSDGKPDCHEATALAITSVFARTWGQIVDADIEVNGVNFIWADLVTSPDAPAGSMDLQNALTHEVGHLIGLDHTCTMEDGPAPRDNNGLMVPVCDSAAAAVRATTMFASADAADVSKRDLEPDDRQAVCDTYPLGAKDPLLCEVPDMGGCRIASADTDGGSRSWARRNAWEAAGVALAIGAVLLGARRRLRRR